MRMLSRTRPEPKVDVINECIKLLSQDGGNTKAIVKQMLIDYKEYLQSLSGFSYHQQCKECDILKKLNYFCEKSMLQDKYDIKDENELGDILCKYVYDHGGPDMVIFYNFNTGLTVSDRDYSKDEAGLRITPTGFECYGIDDNEYDWE